ncbi:enoyl-CoA hydratase/isomerase family protein [Marinomonas algicola]|uniref:enoyl-CoA hydratase/isomerase family protein n=1 Tax=Marinomonas algicola TaxID=2773454 RepID=UPI00174E3F1E|nr:enoyl-CoA hydratase/isomerase family protein [Marinomonas algicola]
MALIEFEQKDTTGFLYLSNPDKGNALSPAMVESMILLLEKDMPSEITSLVIIGRGRHLCTGFDLSDIEELSDGDLLLRFVRIEHLLQLIQHASYTTIAFNQGAAYGAGADLFSACQYRFASESAKFSFPGPNFGLVLGTRRLSNLIGANQALSLIGNKKPIRIETALETGLVTHCIEESDLLETISNAATSFSPETTAALRAAALIDTRQMDMNALVQSASKPGLKNRILTYRKSLTQK